MMLFGEHSRNNTLRDSVLKNCLLQSIKSTHPVSRCSMNITDHRGCRQVVSHLSKDKNELKKCDQYVVGIILFPHVNIDHKTEWGHPLWVESYITYFLDSFKF